MGPTRRRATGRVSKLVPLPRHIRLPLVGRAGDPLRRVGISLFHDYVSLHLYHPPLVGRAGDPLGLRRVARRRGATLLSDRSETALAPVPPRGGPLAACRQWPVTGSSTGAGWWRDAGGWSAVTLDWRGLGPPAPPRSAAQPGSQIC